MVYKIQCELPDITSVFESIEQFGEFMFAYNTFYLSANTNKSSLIKKIKKSIGKDCQLMVNEVDSKQLSFQPPTVQSWIKDILFKEEVKKYENDNQEMLKRYNFILDLAHQELEKQINMKGVDSDNYQEGN